MRNWFYAVVALQLLFLIGEVAVNTVGLASGQVVVLETAPVDPRSLLMGNYIQLSYKISTIDLQGVKVLGTPTVGAPVYVGLASNGQYAQVVSVADHRPTPDQGLIWLRGTVTSSNGYLRVNYGLDRYYIRENKSEEVNRMTWRGGSIAVVVAVDNAGTARIKKILIDGQPISF